MDVRPSVKVWDFMDMPGVRLMATKFYVTSYCNFAHRLSDGSPIRHECYVLPPESLKAEMEGDYEKAIDILRNWSPKARLRP